MSGLGSNPELLLMMFASGLVISCLATFLGVGGGIIMVPLLIFVFPRFGVSSLCAVHLAIGTSLLVIFIRSIPATISYRRRDLVIAKTVMPLALASIVGTLAGSTLAAHLAGETLKNVFALLLFVAAAHMAFSRPIRSEDAHPRTAWWLVTLVGIVAGFFSALLGIGGGLITVPLMGYLLKFPTSKLAGTSTAVMIITSLVAMLEYVYHGWGHPELPTGALGYVHWAAAIPLALGGMISAPWGAALNHRLNVIIFKNVFAVVLVIVAVRMLLS